MTLLLITLSIIIYQDLKSRAISWWTIPMLLASVIYIRSIEQGWNMILVEGGLNLGFLIVQLVLISTYFSVKQRQFTNIADTYLGWGDILFLIPIAFLFPTFSFVIFYVSSVLVVLLGFLFYKKIINNKIETIPLAGGQAIYLILVLISSKVFDFNIESYYFPPIY